MTGRPMDLCPRERMDKMDLEELKREEAVNAIWKLRQKRISEERESKRKDNFQTPTYKESEIDYYVSENRVRHSKRRGRK